MPAKLQKYLSTIVGVLVTVSLSLISDFVLGLPREITWLTFVIGSIVTVTTTLLEQRVLDSISADLNQKIEIYQILEEIKDPELHQLAQLAISACIEKLKDYQKGFISSSEHSYLVDRFSLCHKNYQATFWASNVQSLYHVEDNPAARSYYESNFEAVKQGIRVDRIFLLNKEDMLDSQGKFMNDRALRIMTRQKDCGINVRVVWLDSLSRIPDNAGLHQDFAITDGKEVSVQLYGVGNSRPGTLLIKQREKVQEYQEIYRKLWKLSRSLEEMISENPPSTN